MLSIEMWTVFSGEHSPRDDGILLRVADDKIFDASPLEADTFWFKDHRRHLVTLDEDHLRGCGRGDFIEAIVAVHDESSLHRPTQKHRRNELHPLRVGHPKQLSADMARVREWSKDIEHGRNPEFSSHGSDIAHCRMKDAGEAESQRDL